MIISSDSVCRVSFTTLYLVTFVKFQAFVAKCWLLEVRITRKVLYSSAIINDFCKQGTRIKICICFVSLADFFDIWHVESWDFKLCHGIGPPAGESREFSHKCVIFESHSVRGTAFKNGWNPLAKRYLFKEAYPII